TSADRFFRIDRMQEQLHFLSDMSAEELFVLDPETPRPASVSSGAAPGMPDLTCFQPMAQRLPAVSSSFSSRASRQLIDAHSRGADLLARDSEGRSALHHAAAGGHRDLVKHILETGPFCQGSPGNTALHGAAAGGHRTVCYFLVEAGASLLKTNSKGDLAGDVAREAGELELAAFLENRQHQQMITRDDQETAV
ncbi:unnamed protein product, partial [Lampetra planeri]